ncbi:hypothetical protein BV898_20099, partial [Hypsibius exemplaris]
LSSSQIGFVTAVGELGRIACLLGFSFYGELSHRPRVIAISAMLTVFAYILLDIPDLASPTSSSEDLMKNEVCQASSVQPLNETAISLTKCEKFDQRYGWRVAAMVVFAVSHFLSGCASGIPL